MCGSISRAIAPKKSRDGRSAGNELEERWRESFSPGLDGEGGRVYRAVLRRERIVAGPCFRRHFGINDALGEQIEPFGLFRLDSAYT